MSAQDNAEAPQVTASEGLAQGVYKAARARVKPLTLRTKGVDSTNVPQRITFITCVSVKCYVLAFITIAYLHECIFVLYKLIFVESDAFLLALQDGCLSKMIVSLTFLLINETTLLCYFKSFHHSY